MTDNQLMKAITEAEAYHGPSLIIAYAPCINHGIRKGMGNSQLEAKLAVECGAKFIVSPGYDEEVVSWCCAHSVPVTPGCVTPTEIMAALKHGLKVLKFFPANVYGGLSALKALSGPFGGVKFIPTGGVGPANLADFAAAPQVHAVGGSWVCPKGDIAAHSFEKIVGLCREARQVIEKTRP